MAILTHFLLFLVAAAITWFFAGLLVESVNSVAKRYHQSGFTVAFFVLGFLTSISEISVMVNSTFNHVPEVSAGNLVGASLVILLFIIPLLAILGNSIQLRHTLHRKNLAAALFVTLLPVLLVLDGSVSKSEGLICFLAFGTLLYFIHKQNSNSVPKVIEAVEEELIDKNQATVIDFVKIVVGGIFIFLAGHFLVDEAVYFSAVLSIPSSIVGLLVLSVGTNIPELVIAVRSILKKHKDIAFGDYLGSAVANTFVFGFLPWLNGKFSVEPTEFIFTAILMTAGFIGFYMAATSQNKISRLEGFWLVSIYGVFVLLQLINVVRFAID